MVLVAVAAAAIRVQRAAAAAGFVPLLVLVDGHEALGFAFFSAAPRKISVSLAVAGRRLATWSSLGALLPPLLTD